MGIKKELRKKKECVLTVKVTAKAESSLKKIVKFSGKSRRDIFAIIIKNLPNSAYKRNVKKVKNAKKVIRDKKLTLTIFEDSKIDIQKLALISTKTKGEIIQILINYARSEIFGTNKKSTNKKNVDKKSHPK